jgi:excisionase family DNA binding protein
MVQGYYTLDEAARILGVSAEELSQMAQRHEVRGFTDRGTWRFRTQDIEELARRRGLGSNPDLPLGEAPKAKSEGSPMPAKTPADSGSVFHFNLGDEGEQVEIGQEILSGSSAGKKAGGSKPGSKPGSRPKSPPPKPGSDSDVRLVSDGSDVGLVSGPGSSVRTPSPKKPSGPKQDSGVRLVMDEGPDSDVQIVPDSDKDINILGGAHKKGSDSDIRLEPDSGTAIGKSPDDSMLTEEIDLDAELRKAEEAAKPRREKPKAKTPLPKTPLPKTSPFDLTDSDLTMPKVEKPAAKTDDSSSDFDLSISPEEISPLELSSGEMAALKSPDDEVALGETPAKATGESSDSGINLQEPADSGISLERKSKPDSSEELEFEISLDAESTPKPAKAEPNIDSSSEFELTLEDSAKLAPLESDEKEEKDIFETDFEVPALEEESGSQVAALEDSDTDLESSDFDLALGEEDAAASEESGSQVVALEDEEEVDEAAATVARTRGAAGAAELEEDEGVEPLGDEELATEEAGAPARRMVVAAAPADWGVFTPVVLLVSVIVLFLVGVMSFELVRGMWAYHQPGKASSVVVRGVAGLFYDSKDLPTD